MAGKPDDDALIAGFFYRSLAALQAAAKDAALLRLVGEIAQAIEASMRGGGKLLIAGNGGSAADAQHLAAEFLSRYLVDRRPLPALALTTDTSGVSPLLETITASSTCSSGRCAGSDGRATCFSPSRPRDARRTFCARCNRRAISVS